jgi:hypothetical protein
VGVTPRRIAHLWWVLALLLLLAIAAPSWIPLFFPV